MVSAVVIAAARPVALTDSLHSNPISGHLRG
jgi:hypothetical protein